MSPKTTTRKTARSDVSRAGDVSGRTEAHAVRTQSANGQTVFIADGGRCEANPRFRPEQRTAPVDVRQAMPDRGLSETCPLHCLLEAPNSRCDERRRKSAVPKHQGVVARRLQAVATEWKHDHPVRSRLVRDAVHRRGRFVAGHTELA